jgi:phosphoglycolate phosphatase
MKYDTVIFDFDYTLADSSEGIIECVNFAMSSLGLSEQTPVNIRSTIGMSLPKTFEVLTGLEGEDIIIEFRRLFKIKADEVINKKTVVFDNVEEIIGRLRKADMKTAIVSTKFRYRIAEILERENLLTLFDLIVGGEDVHEHKPNPEGLNQAVTRLKSRKEDTVYIGDSVIDAKTAQRAGVDFMAVLSGVTSCDDFNSHISLAFLDSLCQLPEILLTSTQ